MSSIYHLCISQVAKVINAAPPDLIYSLLLCNDALMAMRFCELVGSRGVNNTICLSSILEQSSAIPVSN